MPVKFLSVGDLLCGMNKEKFAVNLCFVFFKQGGGNISCFVNIQSDHFTLPPLDLVNN